MKDESNGIKEFEKELKPFIDKRNDAEKDLVSAKNRLENFQTQREKCQTALNDAVRESAEGKADVEAVNTAKHNLDSIGLLCDELETNAIPRLKENVKQANTELIANLQTLLAPLKEDHLNRMNQLIKQGLDVGVEYITYVESTIKELGLVNIIPWFEKEGLMCIAPSIGVGLSPYILSLMRLGK